MEWISVICINVHVHGVRGESTAENEMLLFGEEFLQLLISFKINLSHT